jgi:uncharacterized protein (TIGR00645 family)
MSDEKKAGPTGRRTSLENPAVRTLEAAVIFSRWLQLPLLLGLLVAFAVFEFVFAGHLFSLILDSEPLTRTKVILVTLDLIDMVLIANLIVMVIISGYKIFISPLRATDDSTVPRWLRSATPGELKLRIATTVLLISTIHLLHLFLDPAQSAEQDAQFMLAAQIVFAFTTLVFVAVEYFEHRD